MALAGLLGGLWAYSPATPSGNMNGEYVVSSGAGKSAPKFNTDYASKGHEYFDVWSPEIATRMPPPVRTTGVADRTLDDQTGLSVPRVCLAFGRAGYAEVWWHDMGKQPLPQERTLILALPLPLSVTLTLSLPLTLTLARPASRQLSYSHLTLTLTLALPLPPNPNPTP